MVTNSIKDYTTDYVIKDISSSINEQRQFSSLPNNPLTFTVDGPLSLKGTNQPYKVYVYK